MVGQKVSHFEIVSELGRGGMGVVYKGHDTRLDRFVALKFLSESLARDPRAADRFLLEARAAAALEHINVCSIFEIGDADSRPYIVMGFCDGKSLRDVLATAPPNPEETTSLARQIALGLAHAHRNGVVHRDLKPGNIIITRDGTAKIVDFGIASLKDTTTVVGDDAAAGTPAYMAPEQVRGEASDHRSDIWSYGVLLYEMWSGKNPFAAGYDQASIYNVLNTEPPSLDSICDDLPNGWSSLVQRCLAKDQSERFESFNEILAALPIDVQTSSDTKTRLEFRGYLPNPGTRFYIGRADAQDHLTERLSKPYGSTTLISGESGIGKTQLASRVLTQKLEDGGHVLWGRCLFNEGALPYHPFVAGLKKGFQSSTDIVADLETFAIRRGGDLRRKRPHLQALFAASDDSGQVLNREQIWHTLLLVYHLLSNHDDPLYLVVDDMQWADPATIALFCYLSRSIEQSNIHLIGLYRLDASASSGGAPRELLVDSIRQLRIDGLAAHIELERFDRAESDTFVETILETDRVDDKLKDYIFKQSQGLPLFLAESLNILKLENRIVDDGRMWKLRSSTVSAMAVSSKVQDVILQRLDALEEDDRELLEIAAVQGEVFQSEPLGSCLEWPRIKILKRLQYIEKTYQLIMHERSGYRFDHTMIRHVLYDSILPELAAEYHRLVAEYLEQKMKSDDDQAAIIAHHLIAAGQDVDAVPFLLRAANRARAVHASSQALSIFNELDRIQGDYLGDDVPLQKAVSKGLGDVHYSLGDVQSALGQFRINLKLAEQEGDLQGQLEARRRLADSLRITGQLDEASQVIEGCLTIARASNSEKEVGRALLVQAEVSASKGAYQESAEAASEAHSIAEKEGDVSNESIAASIMGFAYWHMGSFQRAQEQFSKALTSQREIGDRLGMATTLNFLALSLWKLGQHEEAIRCARESVDIKRKISLLRAVPGSLNIIGDVYRDTFALDKAIEYHTDSLDLATAHDNKGAMCDNLRDLGADYLDQGDLGTAEGFMNKALALSKSSGIKWYETRSAIGLANIKLRSGDQDAAKSYAKRGLQLAEEIQARELLIEARWTLGLTLTDDPEQMEKLLKGALVDVDQLGLGTLSWQIRASLAEHYRLVGNKEEERRMRHEAWDIVSAIAERITDHELRACLIESDPVSQIRPF